MLAASLLTAPAPRTDCPECALVPRGPCHWDRDGRPRNVHTLPTITSIVPAAGPAHGGTELFFDGTYVSEGTTPAGSAWAKNPIPRNDKTGQHGEASGFPPHCKDVAMCQGMTDGSTAVPDLAIVDRVLVPKGTPPGAFLYSPLR